MVNWLDHSYGKYPSSNADYTVIMEYNTFLSYAIPYMSVTPPADYISYVNS